MRTAIFKIIFLAWVTAFYTCVFANETYKSHHDGLDEAYTSRNRTTRLSHRRRDSDDDIPRGRPLYGMPRPHKGDIPYGGSATIFTCANPGQIALTFDDGPWYWTEEILHYLNEFQARATFFVVGHNLLLNRRIDDDDSQWPELLKTIHEAGHQLGSHTWTHRHLEDISRQQVFDEIVYNEMAFRNVLGFVPTYMRPPYGVWRDPGVRKDMEALGYHVVMYNVDTKDYLHNDEDGIDESIKVFNEAIDRNGTGSYIVLSHDIRQWTALKLVPEMLKTMVERGYEAVTVGECLNDPWTNWYRYPE